MQRSFRVWNTPCLSLSSRMYLTGEDTGGVCQCIFKSQPTFMVEGGYILTGRELFGRVYIKVTGLLKGPKPQVETLLTLNL